MKRVSTKADAESVARKLVALARRGEKHTTKLLFDVLDPQKQRVEVSAPDGGVIPLERPDKRPIDFERMEQLAAQLFGFDAPPTGNGEQSVEATEPKCKIAL